MMIEKNKIVNFLDYNGIEYIKLDNLNIEKYKQEWFNNFVLNDKKEEALNICFDRDNCQGFLWHIFSYKVLDCYCGNQAIKIFDSLDEEQEVILLDNIYDSMYHIKNIFEVKSYDLENFEDIILTDINFKWTYVKTHEFNMGPYFYSITKY